MATVRQLPRAGTASVDLIVIPEGALYVDIERNELRLGDGTTPGGIRIPSIDQLNNLFLAIGEGLGAEVGFPTSGVGVLVRLADSTFTVRALGVGTGLLLTNPVGALADPSYTIDQQWIFDNMTARIALVSELRAGLPGKLVGTSQVFVANAYVPLDDTPTIAVDFNGGWNFRLTITADRILGFPTNIKVQSGIISVRADAVAPRLLTLASGWKDPLSLFPLLIPANQRVMLNYFVSELSEVIVSGALIIS